MAVDQPSFSPNTSIELMTGDNTLTQNLNFLQPSNFKVVIDRKKFANLEFFCQRVVHPGLIINTPTIPYKRIGNIAIAGDTAEFEDLSFDVIIDEEMKSYIEVYEWLLRQVETNHVASKYSGNSNDEPHQVDMTLSITSSHNNTVKQIKYIDCIPTNIGTMLMESVTSETPIITFPVTFKIGYFEVL